MINGEVDEVSNGFWELQLLANFVASFLFTSASFFYVL